MDDKETKSDDKWDLRLTRMQETFTKQTNERADAQDAKWEARIKRFYMVCMKFYTVSIRFYMVCIRFHMVCIRFCMVFIWFV